MIATAPPIPAPPIPGLEPELRTPVEGLTGVELAALAVCQDVYEAVHHAPALDDRSHWDRYANRLRSAAYAQTAPRFLEQVARRFGVAHTPGDRLAGLLALPPRDARQILAVIRAESNALSVLVRDNRGSSR